MASVAPVTAQRGVVSASKRIETTDLKWMLGLGGVALVLRLWFALSVGQTSTRVLSDATVYQAIAENLVHGQGYAGITGQATAQFPPGYPLLLALVFSVFGVHPTAGAIVNALLGAVTVPLLYFTARRTLGRVEAIFAGIGMTVLFSQIIYADLLLSETLFTFLVVVVLALAAVVKPTRVRSAVLLGAVIAAATLTRGVGVVLIVIPLAMWWRAVPRRLLQRQALTMLAVVLAFVVPWTVRNAYDMHAFVPLSTDLGVTLWAGHSPQAYGGPLLPPQRLLSSIHYPPASTKFELAENRLLRNKAVSWAAAHPLDELRLIPLKLLSLVSGDGLSVAYWLDEPTKPLLSSNAQGRVKILANIGGYAVLVLFLASLAVFGRALWRRRPILRGALLYLAVSAVLYGFVFFGGFRYFASLEPLMLLVAAPLAARLWMLRAQRLGDSPRP
jgi:4-amino-4-deoxy-L-arabinose transferase-like glycosyltransferase